MAESANPRMTPLTLCERRGHRDLHSIQTAEVTAGVQSHNSSCVTDSRERQRAHTVQICSHHPILSSVTVSKKNNYHMAFLKNI